VSKTSKIIFWAAVGLFGVYVAYINPVDQWGLISRISFISIITTGFLAYIIYELYVQLSAQSSNPKYKVKMSWSIEMTESDEHSGWTGPSVELFTKNIVVGMPPTIGMEINDDEFQRLFEVERVTLKANDETIYLYRKDYVETREQLDYSIEEFKGGGWCQETSV